MIKLFRKYDVIGISILLPKPGDGAEILVSLHPRIDRCFSGVHLELFIHLFPCFVERMAKMIEGQRRVDNQRGIRNMLHWPFNKVFSAGVTTIQLYLLKTRCSSPFLNHS